MTYETIVEIARAHEGERGRVVYRNGAAQRSGLIATRDYGHCVDVTLDGHGGWFFGEDQVTDFQLMVRGRYVSAPVAPTCDRCGQAALDQVHAPSGAFLCAACFHGSYGAGEKHETVRLFAPAPAVTPGQLTL